MLRGLSWKMGVDNGLYTVRVVGPHDRLGILGLLVVVGVVKRLGEERCILAVLGLEIMFSEELI